MSRDWHEWHAEYDADTPLRRRLAVVQGMIGEALDTMAPGPIIAISMCAGEGRDLLGVLRDHPRRDDVRGRLVELDPGLASRAATAAPAGVDVLCADAGTTSAYDGVVPADLVLVCGVFSNITDADIRDTVAQLPALCAEGARVIWTRHRRPPDRTVDIRAWFEEAGFEAMCFESHADFPFGVGMHRLTGQPAPYRPAVRLFRFVGFDALA